MNVYALQTVRGGSKSVPNKNLLCPYDSDIPIYFDTFMSAVMCKEIDGVFISTDILEIINDVDVARNGQIIKRPEHLCRDDSSHYETIIHGLNEIEKRTGKQVDLLVILLGNCITADDRDLTNGINHLKLHKEFDSCMSVSRYNMFNPFRAYRVTPEGATTYVSQDVIKQAASGDANCKDAFGDVYFFNGSFWICKRETLIRNDGLLPFPWLGKKILPYIQDEGIMEIDAPWQVDLL